MIRFKNWLIKKLGGFTKIEVLKITETYEEPNKTVTDKNIKVKEIVGKSSMRYCDIAKISEKEVEHILKGKAIYEFSKELDSYINIEFLDKPWSMEKEMFIYIKIVEGK